VRALLFGLSLLVLIAVPRAESAEGDEGRFAVTAEALMFGAGLNASYFVHPQVAAEVGYFEYLDKTKLLAVRSQFYLFNSNFFARAGIGRQTIFGRNTDYPGNKGGGFVASMTTWGGYFSLGYQGKGIPLFHGDEEEYPIIMGVEFIGGYHAIATESFSHKTTDGGRVRESEIDEVEEKMAKGNSWSVLKLMLGVMI